MLLDKQYPEHFFRSRWIQHLLFWTCVLFYFTVGYARNGKIGLELVRSAAFLPNHMFIVYSFLYFLIPKFLFTRKFLLFILLAIVVYAISMLFSYLINFHILGVNRTSWSFGASLLGQSTVLGIAISLKLLKNWYRQKRLLMVAENQKISAELELLKSQVHPHFLFNTLNNLYAHTLEQSEKAPEIVLKLSHLLRFMIYESNTDSIPLKKEISLLQQYIELEQLRYGKRLDVSVSVRGNLDHKQIAPLLLLPVVENAFKYGTSKQIDQCWISFDLEVKGNKMIFKLVNSKDKESKQNEGEIGGLGLTNVKKRLGYLYPEKHFLQISEDEEVFIVTLQIELAEVKQTIISPIPDLQKQNNGTEMFIGR